MDNMKLLSLFSLLAGLFMISKKSESKVTPKPITVNDNISAPKIITQNDYGLYNISEMGINYIKRFEQLRLEPYDDGTGTMTIGWGHAILPHESFTKITRTEADNLLLKDLSIAERAVNRYVKVPLNQNQYDSLVSFVFNVGVNAFYNSTLLKLLNQQRYNNAANEFKKWRYSKGKVLGGLIARREHEKQLFLS